MLVGSQTPSSVSMTSSRDRVYWPVFEDDGLNHLSRTNGWDQMAAELSDDVVRLFATVGRHDELVRAVGEWVGGIVDTVAASASRAGYRLSSSRTSGRSRGRTIQSPAKGHNLIALKPGEKRLLLRCGRCEVETVRPSR